MKKEYTIEERAAFLEGQNVWQTHTFEQYQPLFMADGPHGLRKQRNLSDHLGSQGSEVAICYPTASLLACSFDPALVEKMATLLATEAAAMGVHILLGPGINIKRNPLCGRNFEYFSEDPLLSATLGRAYVKGLQQAGIGCSVKHFCCNNQETFRFHADSIVDERTLHEIYLKAFRACVQEKPASIMASYNRINGYYATEHPKLKKVLREDWAYQGLLISDWGAISNRIQAVKNGLDLAMPSSHGYYTQALIRESKVSDDIRVAINQSFKRITNTIVTYQRQSIPSFKLDDHHEEARKLASESMVLLKNDGILPLQAKEKVLFIGAFTKEFRYQGGGSSYINSYRIDQIEACLPEYMDHPACIEGYSLDEDGWNPALYEEGEKLAGLYHKVVLFLGLPLAYETEGLDRSHLNLPVGQSKLLKRLLMINPNLVCVICSGSVVNLQLASQGKGLLMAYLSGEAGARAILDILY
ncbi:MAG: glycoside hydrolase family 3 N-terminal domain-containing protein, partial [Bacilli bacterium]